MLFLLLLSLLFAVVAVDVVDIVNTELLPWLQSRCFSCCHCFLLVVVVVDFDTE